MPNLAGVGRPRNGLHPRSDVAALLDRVEDGHGGRSADYCLTIVRAIMNWHAARRDEYSPPIIKGMRRQSTSAQAADPESRRRRNPPHLDRLRDAGTYGALLRMLLLTTQRFDKALTMAWADIDADGVWRIPNVSKREKPHGGELKLPRLARDLIAALPVLEGNPYVFAGRGQGHTNGHSKNKARLDRVSGVTDWVVHDLRRTARSLLSRAGVRPTSPNGRWAMSSQASQRSMTGTPISTRRRTHWRSLRR